MQECWWCYGISIQIFICFVAVSFDDLYFPVFDVEDESTEIGLMNVTVKCVDALQAVKLEMTQPPDADEEAE